VFAFKQPHEHIDVNMIEDYRSALIPLLDGGAIDIAVVLGEPSYQDYAHLNLWSERIMVAFQKTHWLAKRDLVY
jgi:DNA-binding transcriptional LysR family regulator